MAAGTGNITREKTWSTGETLTAANLNDEFDNILDNLNPSCIDDESADNAAAQATSDPYPSASLSKATSLETEIKQLRYMIAQLTGQAYWYVDTAAVGMMTAGWLQRPKFRWKDADEIYIGPGAYELQGADNKIVYWDSEITYKLGSGGSNDESDDVDEGAQAVHYICLDDSNIGTATNGRVAITTADKFISGDSITPTWSDSKHGWYSDGGGNTTTSDRVIFAVICDSGNNVLEFFHDGGDEVFLAARIDDRALADLDDTWTDVTLSIPGFSTKAQCRFYGYADAAAGNTDGYWRTNGQSDAVGHCVNMIENDSNVWTNNNIVVMTDSSQKIEVKYSASAEHQMGVYTNSWFFSRGL